MKTTEGKEGIRIVWNRKRAGIRLCKKEPVQEEEIQSGRNVVVVKIKTYTRNKDTNEYSRRIWCGEVSERHKKRTTTTTKIRNKDNLFWWTESEVGSV